MGVSNTFLRSHHLFMVGIGIIVLVIMGLSNWTCVETKSPNILFIAVDDLRPQLGCYGEEQIISPNIDRIAREGILFEQAYCQQPICMATRASLFTGYRPDHAQIHRGSSVKKLLPGVTTLTKYFEQHGYDLWATGKVYHYGEDNLEQFGKNYVYPKGNWQGKGYLSPGAITEMTEYAKGYDELRPNDAGSRGKGPAFEAADVADNEYPDGVSTDLAIEQLQKFAKGSKPFFMAVGYMKPHLPFNAPKKYWDKYSEKDITLADNPFLPEGATNYTLYNFSELRNYSGIPKDDKVFPDDLSRTLIHAYSACVTYIDAQIGRLLKELDRQNLRENTIIILWGDHGWKLGEHGMWCKHTPFELDCRVPLIISTPGLENAGEKTRAFSELVDIYPTLCELSGLKIPDHIEGNSLVPVLKEPSRDWKKAVFTQTTKHARMQQDPEKVLTGYSVKTKKYRYTEWTLHKNREILARELYNHQTDPDENKNIADLPQNKSLVAELSLLLEGGQGWHKVRPN